MLLHLGTIKLVEIDINNNKCPFTFLSVLCYNVLSKNANYNYNLKILISIKC